MGIGSDIIDDGMVMYGNNIQTYEEEARANQESKDARRESKKREKVEVTRKWLNEGGE